MPWESIRVILIWMLQPWAHWRAGPVKYLGLAPHDTLGIDYLIGCWFYILNYSALLYPSFAQSLSFRTGPQRRWIRVAKAPYKQPRALWMEAAKLQRCLYLDFQCSHDCQRNHIQFDLQVSPFAKDRGSLFRWCLARWWGRGRALASGRC
jgi:hypothetical protein